MRSNGLNFIVQSLSELLTEFHSRLSQRKRWRIDAARHDSLNTRTYRAQPQWTAGNRLRYFIIATTDRKVVNDAAIPVKGHHWKPTAGLSSLVTSFVGFALLPD